MHEAGQKEAAKVFLPLGTSLDVSQLDLCEGLQVISLKRYHRRHLPHPWGAASSLRLSVFLGAAFHSSDAFMPSHQPPCSTFQLAFHI
ncbi:unnamed protein product, partial [Closterium sp. Naga37s-1]